MDTPVPTAPVTDLAPAPFVPQPLPPSRFADPTKAIRTVMLEMPVTDEAGRTWSAICVRRFTVDQVATVVRNWTEARKADPDLPLAFPSFVDTAGVEVPEAVMRLLDDDDMQTLQKAGQDFLPRRFRPLPEETTTE